MSQLITLSKLAALVHENTGIETAVCEAFIRNMAQTAASGLIEGEHIRIKDLGLFEIRHTVDGDVIVEFVPESPFAERVNAPYAHLRPSVVSGQSINPVDSRQSAMPQAPAYIPQPEPSAYPPRGDMPQSPAYTPQPEIPAFPQRPDMTGTPAHVPQPEMPGYMSHQHSMPQPASYPGQAEGPAYSSGQKPETFNQTTEFPHSPSLSPQLQDEAPDLPSYLNLPSPENSETDSTVTHAHDPFSSEASHPAGFNRQLPQLSVNKKYALIGALGLICGFILGYLTANFSSSENQDAVEDRPVTTKISDTVPTPPVQQEYDYNTALSVADVDTIFEDNEIIDTPEVRPEPEIVTVKLQKGQRLSDIALKHYGKKEFWVYIYLENRESISNPFTVREGAVLRIPPKDKYAPTTDEATNLAWAKSKAAEINSKYIN